MSSTDTMHANSATSVEPSALRDPEQRRIDLRKTPENGVLQAKPHRHTLVGSTDARTAFGGGHVYRFMATLKGT